MTTVFGTVLKKFYINELNSEAKKKRDKRQVNSNLNVKNVILKTNSRPFSTFLIVTAIFSLGWIHLIISLFDYIYNDKGNLWTSGNVFVSH